LLYDHRSNGIALTFCVRRLRGAYSLDSLTSVSEVFSCFQDMYNVTLLPENEREDFKILLIEEARRFAKGGEDRFRSSFPTLQNH